MSLFSISNNKEEEISMVYHIGSGSVAGFIVKLSKISKPEIIYSKRLPILFQKNLDSERHLSLMIGALDLISKDIQNQGVAHLNFTGLRNYPIKKVHYMLSSPWCTSQTKIIKIKKDKSFELSHGLIVDILNEQESKFLLGSSVEKAVIIEKKIIEAKLNGYKMVEIYDKKPNEVEIALFLTSSSKSFLKKIKDTVGKYFNFRSLGFHSFALTSFSVIRDIYPDEESFIYVDIHGELTDLSIIKNGIFTESFSFPIGKNFFIRKLSEKLQVSPDEAVSLVNTYAGKKTNQLTTDNVSVAIVSSLKEWSENFHSTLSSLFLRMNLPRTIFMVINDDLSSVWARKIQDEKFSWFGMVEESFDVIIIDNKKLEENCKPSKVSGKIKKEPVLEMECLFLNKLFNLK